MARKAKWDEQADYVIVGSGASGATVAVELCEQGYETLLLEEGEQYRTEDFRPDIFHTMGTLFRDFGMQMAKGKGVTLILEGSCVGGSTVMNGAIVHRLPEEIFARWQENDPLWRKNFRYSEIEQLSGQIESDLSVTQNLAPFLPKLPAHQTLDALGWAHQPMNRNAPGCVGSDRCLQGCPSGGKWSMERSYLPRAQAKGMRLFSRHRAKKIIFERDRAVGVVAQTAGGLTKRIYAKRAVVVAAGVTQTPLLLWRSGLRHSAIGKHFSCHLGIGVVALMKSKGVDFHGPPQGIEVTEFQNKAIKLATQGLPPELFLARTAAGAHEVTELLSEWENHSGWTASIQSTSEGVLQRDWSGRAKIRFLPSPIDCERVRFGLERLSQFLIEAGAKRVFPGVTGSKQLPKDLRTKYDLNRFQRLPLDARHFLLSAGHLFGTCRLGSEKNQSVVDENFRVRQTKGLHVVCASIFPSNIGVNPQHSIMALAKVGARRMMEA